MIVFTAVVTGCAVALGVGAATGALPTGVRTRRGPTTFERQQQWLIQAGLELTPQQFWAVSLGTGGAGFGLILLLTGVWTVALPPGLLLVGLPRMYFARAREKRMAEIQRAWPDGLRDLVAGISSGASLQRAIEQLAVTGPAPLGDALSRFPFLARSIGVVPALEVVKAELGDPTSDRVIEVLILAHQRGGSIVPGILRDLADATTRDIWALEEIQTQVLEQRINARAVFALPWIVLVAITVQDGAFRAFYSSPGGLVVVAIGAVLSGIGMLIVSRLGAEPAEPRVFGGSPSPKAMR